MRTLKRRKRRAPTGRLCVGAFFISEFGINSPEYQAAHRCPLVKLVPLPSRAQFLNVIESVFSGMAHAVIHNSNYQSADEAKAAIDRHFVERNSYFRDNPRRAGGKIWGDELVAPKFSESNNCKDPRYMQRR